MLKTLHKDQFSEMLFDEQKGIFYSYYSPITEDMEEDEYKQMLITWKNAANLCKASNFVIDSRNLLFPMTPEIQMWIVENINTQVIVQNTKSAFLMPENYILAMGTEQYIDEANNAGREIRYFATVEEAEKWLLS